MMIIRILLLVCLHLTALGQYDYPKNVKELNRNAANFMAQFGRPLKGATFFINGVFTIDQNITFDNCTIYLTPNSQIVVNANTTLALLNCTLQAGSNCGMWDGIYANAGNALVDIQGGTIRDMINGVVIQTAGKLHATNGVNFYDNRISIQLENLPNTYTGTITNCEFKTTATNLKGPYSTYSRGKHGIKINNCQQITIGGTAANKNHFEKLLNGIYINEALANGTTANLTTSYNTFADISGSYSIADPNLDWHSFYQGAGIYANNQNILSQVYLIHYGLNNAQNMDFQNVQKAIHAVGIYNTLEGNYCNQTEAGFLLICDGQTNLVMGNSINNSYLGIVFSGASWGGCSNNIIQNVQSLANSYPGSSIYGKGIEWYSPNGGGLMIRNNIINTLQNDHVVGINLLGPKMCHVKDNQISFNSQSNSINNQGSPNLIGIALNKSNRVELVANTIVGNNNAVNDSRATCGIFMQHSPDNYLSCNTNDYLQTGIQVVGDCRGYRFGNNYQDNAGVEQNRTITTRYGWLLRHLGSNGSFGDIGLPNLYDANNKWQSLIPGNNGNKKVFRTFSQNWQCDLNADPPKIFTNSTNLDANATINPSTSNRLNPIECAYIISNSNPGPAFLCTPAVNELPILSQTVLDEDYAEDIATDSVTYSEFEDMSEQFDERWLFARLAHDSNLRNNYPILNQFYLDNQGSLIDEFNRIDDLILQLADSNTLSNHSVFSNLLSMAKTLNNQINSTELFALVEQQANDYYFTLLEEGIGGLDSAQWEWTRLYAQECPFVAGNGVYKARMLCAKVHPLFFYNDLQICNNVGMFKGGKGLFADEDDELYHNPSHSQYVKVLDKKPLKLFPNPTTGEVNASYEIPIQQQGRLQILDMQGRVVKEISLPYQEVKVTFSIADLSNAVYLYKYWVGDMIMENGKIIKE